MYIFIHFIIIIIIQSFSLQEGNKTKHAKKKGGNYRLLLTLYTASPHK